MNRPTGFFEQPMWTALGLLAIVGTVRAQRVWCGEDDRCTRVRMLVTVPNRPPFTTSHLVAGEEIIEAGTGIPIDVHPTRDLFRLVATDPPTGGPSR
ncbi:hypothetical protein HLK59_03210 [Streptomyces sp. S3(2020)]|uniref:hypothetical protein n=1 Tax=Streptomyces sp. S3(2020) TaxID=2732044 RepID=UPI001488F075|nr:hypothetical protein [Streptomyces sp. S3(2020)]NNN29378.1 hypothetical protein [Streptomyces sp. S3(2020)]